MSSPSKLGKRKNPFEKKNLDNIEPNVVKK